jgi:hypothetical protein
MLIRVDDGIPSPPWDYNVAPTTIQPIIRNNRDTRRGRTHLPTLGPDPVLDTVGEIINSLIIQTINDLWVCEKWHDLI